LLRLNPSLSWLAHPHSIDAISGVSVCDLVGPGGSPAWGKSDLFSLGLIHIPSNTTIPQHGEDVHVLLEVIAGGGGEGGAQIGGTADKLEVVEDGKVVSFVPGAPKVIKVFAFCFQITEWMGFFNACIFRIPNT
jgi:hypothetical protein